MSACDPCNQDGPRCAHSGGHRGGERHFQGRSCRGESLACSASTGQCSLCLGSSHTPVGSGLFKFGLSQDWIAGGAYHHVCHATVVDSTIGLLRGFSGMDATDLDPKTALEAMIKKL